MVYALYTLKTLGGSALPSQYALALGKSNLGMCGLAFAPVRYIGLYLC